MVGLSARLILGITCYGWARGWLPSYLSIFNLRTIANPSLSGAGEISFKTFCNGFAKGLAIDF